MALALGEGPAGILGGGADEAGAAAGADGRERSDGGGWYSDGYSRVMVSEARAGMAGLRAAIRREKERRLSKERGGVGVGGVLFTDFACQRSLGTQRSCVRVGRGRACVQKNASTAVSEEI